MVSVWKLQWFGGNSKLYISLLVVSLILNEIVEHMYRKIYMITNVARLKMSTGSVRIRPQVVWDIDMVWLIRSYSRAACELPVWWFFDSCILFLWSNLEVLARLTPNKCYIYKAFTESVIALGSLMYI